MKAKKVIWGIIAVSAAVLIVIAVLFEFAPQSNVGSAAQKPISQLTGSISYANGKISFTIPKEGNNWNIWISGRMEIEGFGGLSVHYLEEESESSSWENGKTYSFDVTDGVYTDFSMDVSLDDEEVSINMLELLPEKQKNL